MELQTGEFPGWDRSPVDFIKKRSAVSQFATIATTRHSPSWLLCSQLVIYRLNQSAIYLFDSLYL